MYSRQALTEARARQDEPLGATPATPAPVDWEAALDQPWCSWDEAIMTNLRQHLVDNPPHSDPAEAPVYEAVLGGKKVWLENDGGRWRMYVRSRKNGMVANFQSPYLRHAKEVAEDWHGTAVAGWHGVTTAQGKAKDAAN